MLTNRTLARINNRPREVGRVPLLAVGGGVLVVAALLFVFGILPPLAILAVLGGGALLVLLLYMTQKSKMTIELSYKEKLDGETASRFSEVQEALGGLASSEGIWSLSGSSEPPKAGEVGPMPEREPAHVGLLATPGIRADVPVWGIEAGDQSIFFFPEGALIYRDDRYDPLPYKSLKVVFSSGRFFEEEDLPDDATVVERTWRFSRPDGSPDPRYKKDNVEIPIVLYGLLEDKHTLWTKGAPRGLEQARAAAHFASTFGAEDAEGGGERVERRGHGEEHHRQIRLRGALLRMGGGAPFRGDTGEGGQARHGGKGSRGAKGATAEEISAAYRELARTHHPDKVANLEPEVREYSEQRMKEINSAYAELKRQWSEPATEETRAG